MSFSEILKGMTDNVKGAMGAMVVGMDGIIVEEYSADASGADLGSVGAEYGNVLKGLQGTSSSLEMGGTNEVAVMSDTAQLILRKINDEYFVALLLSPGGSLGKGRFMVRSASRRLEKEL